MEEQQLEKNSEIAVDIVNRPSVVIFSQNSKEKQGALLLPYEEKARHTVPAAGSAAMFFLVL